jgi:hypothetical protein
LEDWQALWETHFRHQDGWARKAIDTRRQREGDRLARDLQAEVRDFADVRSEF